MQVFLYLQSRVESCKLASDTRERTLPGMDTSFSANCCALESTALHRARQKLEDTNLCAKHLLKTLQFFRYQNLLAEAREESHRTMIAAFRAAHPGESLAGLITDPSLMLTSVYFPQEDVALTAQLNEALKGPGAELAVLLTLTFAHEDYVHKAKRAACAVAKHKNDSEFALFGRPEILAAATHLAAIPSGAGGATAQLKAITRLMGEGTGVDEMSFAAMKQVFTFRPLHEHLARTNPALAEALGVFGDYIEAFDRAGIPRAKRITAMQRFIELFDRIMPCSFHEQGYMPAFVGGLPSKVWLALRRNADARLYMFAVFPNVDIIDRALGTFDLEASFSEVVRGAGQYKPYASACMKIMGKIDYLCETMREEEAQRGFITGHAARGSRAQYAGAGGDGSTTLAQWVAPDDDDGCPRRPPKGDNRRLKHALTTYTLVARDYSKLRQKYWAKAP